MKNLWIYGVVFILSFVSHLVAIQTASIFESGNASYSKGHYQAAIKDYQSLIQNNQKNGAIYYNLGNAYFRSNLIGQAIWSYMKALGIDPRNEDIKHNLSVAKAKTIDRIQIPSTLFVLEYYRYLRNYFTLNEWMLLGSLKLFFISLIFCLYKVGYFGVPIARFLIPILSTITILIHFLLIDKFLQENRNNLAIIIENNVNAYSEPFNKSNTILFSINEGSIADISKFQNEWIEINLIDGKTGWVKSKSIRAL